MGRAIQQTPPGKGGQRRKRQQPTRTTDGKVHTVTVTRGSDTSTYRPKRRRKGVKRATKAKGGIRRIARADYEDLKAGLARTGVRSYKGYLASAHWKKVREHFAGLDPATTCKACDATRWELHHRSYKHMGSLRELSDLVPLCGKCHGATHRLILDETEGVTLWNAHTKLKRATKEAA